MEITIRLPGAAWAGWGKGDRRVLLLLQLSLNVRTSVAVVGYLHKACLTGEATGEGIRSLFVNMFSSEEPASLRTKLAIEE